MSEKDVNTGPGDYCIWAWDEVYELYKTACGSAGSLADGIGCRYCPKCGEIVRCESK